MSASHLSGDQAADRLFSVLAAGTLRSRERFLAQCAQASWAQATAVSPTADAAPEPLPLTRPDSDPMARLFEILAAPGQRRLARYMANAPAGV